MKRASLFAAISRIAFVTGLLLTVTSAEAGVWKAATSCFSFMFNPSDPRAIANTERWKREDRDRLIAFHNKQLKVEFAPELLELTSPVHIQFVKSQPLPDCSREIQEIRATLKQELRSYKSLLESPQWLNNFKQSELGNVALLTKSPSLLMDALALNLASDATNKLRIFHFNPGALYVDRVNYKVGSFMERMRRLMESLTAIEGAVIFVDDINTFNIGYNRFYDGPVGEQTYRGRLKSPRWPLLKPVPEPTAAETDEWNAILMLRDAILDGKLRVIGGLKPTNLYFHPIDQDPVVRISKQIELRDYNKRSEVSSLSEDAEYNHFDKTLNGGEIVYGNILFDRWLSHRTKGRTK